MKKIRFQLYFSQMHKDYLEAMAEKNGIAMVDYLRRLIDKDREERRDKAS